MTTFLSLSAIAGLLLLALTGCSTAGDQHVPHAVGPGYGPAVEHEPGYAPAYKPFQRECLDENSLACFTYRLNGRT